MDWQTYPYLEQRILQYYRAMLAPFHPRADVSEASQRDYHAFVTELLDTLFTQPELLFSSLHEDDAFPYRYNCASYGKPKLKPDMKSIDKKLAELFALLHRLGSGIQDAAVLKKPKLRLLGALGLVLQNGSLTCPRHPLLAEAWQALASAWPDAGVGFSRCWFDPEYPYMEQTVARLYDTKAFAHLSSWLNENGYRRYDCVTRPDALDYAKCIKTPATPLGNPIIGDKEHYGFTLEYRYEARVPQHFELRLIRYADLLTRYDRLSEQTRRMIQTHTKRCNGCRYCVQTDKTGTRPLAALPIAGERLCPYFPGFDYTRNVLTDDEVEGSIALLTDLEKMLTETPSRKKK